MYFIDSGLTEEQEEQEREQAVSGHELHCGFKKRLGG